MSTIREHKNPYTKVAMLQKMASEIKTQVEEQSKAGITPEVQENINSMIALIEGDIESSINDDFAAAQANYAAKLSALDAAVSTLDTLAVTVTDADESATICIGEEEGICRDWEDCEDTMFEWCNTSDAECDDAENYWWTPHTFFYQQHSCDFKHFECDDITTLLNHKATETAKLNQKLDEFVDETNECNEWRQKCDEKRTECAGRWVDRVSKRTECNNDEISDRDEKISSFCEEWWKKCDAEYSLNVTKVIIEHVSVDALGDVTETGSAGHVDSDGNMYGLSEADRIKEWNAVLKIKCLLKSYTEGTTENNQPHFREDVQLECEADAAHAYPNIFEYSQETVDLLTAKYPCWDSTWTIQFNPGYWHETEPRSVVPLDCNQYTYETDHFYVKGEMCPEWSAYR